MHALCPSQGVRVWRARAWLAVSGPHLQSSSPLPAIRAPTNPVARPASSILYPAPSHSCTDKPHSCTDKQPQGRILWRHAHSRD
jgi:hypothetical protein